MDNFSLTQGFNKHNSLYQIVFNYFVENNIPCNGREPKDISKTLIRKLIHSSGVLVNSVRTWDDSYKVKDGDIVEISRLNLKFVCKRNLKADAVATKRDRTLANDIDLPKTEETGSTTDQESNIDHDINVFFEDRFECLSIEDLITEDTKKAFCYAVCLFECMPFDDLKKSDKGRYLITFIIETFAKSNLPRELTVDKKKYFSGQIIDAIIAAKKEKINEIKSLFNDLKGRLYDNSLNKFHQNYNKIILKEAFSFLHAPLLDNMLVSRIAIENLTKPITEVSAISDIEEKYLFFENHKEIYETYLTNLENAGSYTKDFFSDAPLYLFKLFKTICNAVDQRQAFISAYPTSKKYNFQNDARHNHEVFLFVTNTGEGIAKNIKLMAGSTLNFDFNETTVGILKPREKREVAIPCRISYTQHFLPEMYLIILWEDSSGATQKKEHKITFDLQNVDIPWDDLNRSSPYSIQIIEDKHKLYGRDEIIEELRRNIQSENIESYKIWGQKRVGKSSIVKTLKSLFSESENTLVIYRSILGLRNPDPVKTLNDLGESICSEIIAEIENKVKSTVLRDTLRNVLIPSFDGSFYPLEKFISKLHTINDKLKFIVIIDEFDRINEDFFKATDLGEGFSGSIGKALNERKYVGFILVGSENMQLLDRQGMNYNSYLEREVDTFKKDTEYDSFKNIVLGPVSPHITFSDEAIDKIFDTTNGNPYFTNLICKEVFRVALKNRDSYIDTHLVNSAIDLISKSSQKSHFEHFWGDGLTEESNVKRERTTDIRRRILVSFSINVKVNSSQFPTKVEILKNFKYPEEYTIERYEVDNTINEFFNRKIFYEQNSCIRIKPIIFEQWLCGPGKTLMSEGVSDLEALHREIELEREYALKDEELKRLSENLIFGDKAISVRRYREYFEQFGNSIEQRKIFNLIDSVFYISKEELNEFFRKEQKNIFSKRDIQVSSHAHIVYREGVELYCFSGTYEENSLFGDSFKLMSRIRPGKTIKNIKTEGEYWKKSEANEIIIIEPLIDNTAAIIDELNSFMSADLNSHNVSVKLVTFLITTKAKTSLVKATSGYSNFKLIIYKEIEETKIKPFIKETEIFENVEEASQAFAAVRKKFPMIDRETSLLVLFNSLCPSKCSPILWHESPHFKPLFHNQYGKLEEVDTEKSKEERRTRLFHAYRELTQKMNAYIISYLKQRAAEDGNGDWFIINYVPKPVMQSVSQKWIDEGTMNPKESYFDFHDYKRIIEHNKQPLTSVFTLPGDGLSWCDKVNVLRRDPAHPEKPAPSEEEVEYFEKIRDKVLAKLN